MRKNRHNFDDKIYFTFYLEWQARDIEREKERKRKLKVELSGWARHNVICVNVRSNCVLNRANSDKLS